MLTAILSIYNEQSNLEHCVECILRNEYFESIHVIDDCSTDGSRELVSKLSLKHNRITAHYNTKNIGTCQSLWSVAKSLTSGFVLFASASDRIFPSLSRNAYHALLGKQNAGLWTAKASYQRILPSTCYYPQQNVVYQKLPLSVLTAEQACSLYIRTGRAFEGSCTFYSVPLVKYFGLDYRLRGFADLLLGIQCMCYGGLISSQAYQSYVQSNELGCGYLEQTYINLRPADVFRFLNESYIRFVGLSPDNKSAHIQYGRCLRVMKALILYGYSRRYPKHLSHLAIHPLAPFELARLLINRVRENYG